MEGQNTYVKCPKQLNLGTSLKHFRVFIYHVKKLELKVRNFYSSVLPFVRRVYYKLERVLESVLSKLERLLDRCQLTHLTP